MSTAVNACGRRLVEHRALVWNATVVAHSLALRDSHGAAYRVVRADWVAPAGVWQSAPVHAVVLPAVVRQNIQLLLVAARDWMPVLQGLAGFAFRVRSVLLVRPVEGMEGSAVDAPWALLQHFMTVHDLYAVDVLTRARVSGVAAMRQAGAGLWLRRSSTTNSAVEP